MEDIGNMRLVDLLFSDTGLTLVAGLMGAIWTVFKASSWGRVLRRDRYRKAVQAVEAAVDVTYREYVAAIKAARADGKLSLEEQREARSRARLKAIAIAREQGIDLLETLGRDQIDVWIAKLVKRLKRPTRAAAKPTALRRLQPS